jgi:hypothetical protein
MPVRRAKIAAKEEEQEKKQTYKKEDDSDRLYRIDAKARGHPVYHRGRHSRCSDPNGRLPARFA